MVVDRVKYFIKTWLLVKLFFKLTIKMVNSKMIQQVSVLK